MLGLTGLAGGAAVAGCCANYGGICGHVLPGGTAWGGWCPRDRHLHASDAQHCEKSPDLDPPTLASAITGPIATCVFGLEMNAPPSTPVWAPAACAASSACGRAGSPPSEEAIAKGAAAMSPTGFDWLGLILVAIVLPAILAPLINMVCRRLGWVKDGDLKLD